MAQERTQNCNDAGNEIGTPSDWCKVGKTQVAEKIYIYMFKLADKMLSELESYQVTVSIRYDSKQERTRVSGTRREPVSALLRRRSMLRW